MAEKRHEGGVSYQSPGVDYFQDRELRRHAGVFYLWALGVAAVISGDFSGWNLGFSVGGWGGMFLGTILITIMYLGLTYSIAEMSPALPHTGGAYSFARTAFGPWGGFITGVAENIEYVLTPAVIVYFIGTYLTAIFDTPAAFQPVYWILGYIIFVGLNMRGVELSFMVTVMMTLLAIGVLVTFVVGAIPFFDFGKVCVEHRCRSGDRGCGRAARGQRPLPAVRGLRRPCCDALCGVAVSRHRAAAARGGRIDRSEARHAEGHHVRHVHADRPRLPGPHLQPVRSRSSVKLPMPPATSPPRTAPSRSAPRASRSSTASASSSNRRRPARSRSLPSPGSSPASTPSSSPMAGRFIRCRGRATSRISCRSPTARTRRRMWR